MQNFPFAKVCPSLYGHPGEISPGSGNSRWRAAKKNPFYATTTSLHQRYAGRQDRRKAKIIHKHKIFMQVSATGAWYKFSDRISEHFVRSTTRLVITKDLNNSISFCLTSQGPPSFFPFGPSLAGKTISSERAPLPSRIAFSSINGKSFPAPFFLLFLMLLTRTFFSESLAKHESRQQKTNKIFWNKNHSGNLAATDLARLGVRVMWPARHSPRVINRPAKVGVCAVQWE